MKNQLTYNAAEEQGLLNFQSLVNLPPALPKYPAYKDSGVEWIGEIPEGWITRKFKYCFDLITEQEESNLVKIGLEHIEGKSGKLNYFETEYDGHGVNFTINDILFGKLRPYLAKVWLAEFEGQAVGDFFVFRSKTIESRLGQRIILSEPFIELCNSSTFGAKMPRVNWDFISNIEIPVPSSPEEQTAIAHYLNEKTALIDTLLRQSEKIIALLQEQRSAIINQAVTKGLTHLPPAQGGTLGVPLKDSGVEWIGEVPESWGLVHVKYIGAIKYGLGQPPKEKEGGLPIIRATNIFRGKISTKSLVYVDPDDIPYARDPVLKEDDIIIVRSGAYTGDSAIIPKEFEGAISGYDMTLRVFNANPKFVAFALLSHYMLNHQLILQSLRAAQPHLNAEELGNSILIKPPLSEQTAIAQYLDQKTTEIATLIQKEEQRMALLKEYRASLISEVVTGKARVAV